MLHVSKRRKKLSEKLSVVASFWLAITTPTHYALACGGSDEISARLVIELNFITVNRRLMFDQRSTSWVDGEYNWMLEIEQAFEVVRGRQLHGFLAWFLHIYRLFTCLRLESEGNLEAEEIRRSSGGFWSRRSWKLHALIFSFAFGKGWVQKCRINRPKTSQNHLRQHRKTKVSELYLSDCH